MLSRYERMVAFRYLLARREEGFISVIVTFSILGITLGVAALIIVMAVMHGFRTELMNRVLGINAHISIQSPYEPIANYNDLSQQLSSLEGVELAFPTIQGQVLASYNDRHTGAFVRAYQPEDIKRKTIIADNITLGSLENFMGVDTVIIGRRMAETMQVTVGDKLRLISPQTKQTFIGAIPRVKDYTIVALFDVGMFEYDSSVIFMPLQAAQLYFKQKDGVPAIELSVTDRENLQPVRERVDALTGSRFPMIDWKQQNGDFVNSLDVERSAMFLILTLIMCVAGFMILSGLWMLVISKHKEIAILRTMGATRGMIMRIFLTCGIIIGLFGTGLGAALGVGFATHIQEIRLWLEQTFDTSLFPAAVYFLTEVPAEVKWDDVLRTIGLALAISVIATIFPARRAARTSPVEGLRYE